MRIEKYELVFDRSKTSFDFISEGPKGRILKTVRFTKIKAKGYNNLYNLAFGDKNTDLETIDDLIVTDNQNRDKILATVAKTVDIFIKRRPKSLVFFKGSTPSRTRLYQMAINKYFDELTEIFSIEGFTPTGWTFFQKNKNYLAFLISHK